MKKLLLITGHYKHQRTVHAMNHQKRTLCGYVEHLPEPYSGDGWQGQWVDKKVTCSKCLEVLSSHWVFYDKEEMEQVILQHRQKVREETAHLIPAEVWDAIKESREKYVPGAPTLSYAVRITVYPKEICRAIALQGDPRRTLALKTTFIQGDGWCLKMGGSI